VSFVPDADRRWLLEAIDLSRKCSPTDTAYSVGAIIVAADGRWLSDGYSRETDPYVHAEEVAVAKIIEPVDLATATMYSSLEPCTTRRSRPGTCTQLIVDVGIRRVVFALREPPLLADCRGVELLQAAGVEVVELADLGQLVRDINRNVLATQT
jgi:diaminohydroxyphosphoribosylaminopyrimidine deaminase/5-amino-6-(5-phosphoribosylamino)uracil reductase